MKDELRMYCRLEGWDEEHLRAKIKEDKRLMRANKCREAECAGRKSGSPKEAAAEER